MEWMHDEIRKEYRPTLYPGEKTDNWSLPTEINIDFHKLNAIIEAKYSKEYLKICAFYNKMFPSLKSSDYSQAAYNVMPFTLMDQERTDTGTGTNYNYLKQIVDQLTSRLGTISFTPKLLADVQSFEYILYKDELERILKTLLKDDNLNQRCIEVFHDAAILGYSHMFIDPYTGSVVKANDYELAIFDGQFNKGHIKQMLYRDYAFPVTDTFVYIKDLPEDDSKEILESLTGRATCEFSMYFDCIKKQVFVTINGKTLPPKDYPFKYVLMATFQWDISFAKQLTTSLFDMLYPIQREINKIAAKIQQMVRMYKGSVPVFSSDVDLAVKAISNGSGEALYVDSSRSAADVMTVLNPTPLDPQLDAQIQAYKTAMYELAGIQSASFDMENMRSAAAVVALDQTRDAVFQAQLAGMSFFIKQVIQLYIDYYTVYPDLLSLSKGLDFMSIHNLIQNSYIELTPVHINDPLSKDNTEDTGEGSLDYFKTAISRITLEILKGQMTFDSLPYYIDYHDVLFNIGMLLIKFEALGVDIPDTLHVFLMQCYIEEVKAGEVHL